MNKQVEFPAEIDRGRLRLNNERQFKAYIAGVPYKHCSIVIKKRKGKPKTLNQLGYYYVAIVPLVKQELISINGGDIITITIGGHTTEVLIDKLFTDRFLKKKCARINEDGLLSMEVPRDTRKIHNKETMSKTDCMQFLDNVINWCAKNMGLVIPEPITMV